MKEKDESPKTVGVKVDEIFVESGVGGAELGIDHNADEPYLAKIFRALIRHWKGAKETIRIPREVTIGAWQEEDEYKGIVKEFGIFSSAETFSGLLDELKGLSHAHITGYKKLRESVGDKAILYYTPGKDWDKVTNTMFMPL